MKMETKQMALIKDGVVQNIVVFDSADIENERWKAGFCIMNDMDELVEAQTGFWIGDFYQNGKFELCPESVKQQEAFENFTRENLPDNSVVK